jgi:hypothetical protein
VPAFSLAHQEDGFSHDVRGGSPGEAGRLRKLRTPASGRLLCSERQIERTCFGPAAAQLRDMGPSDSRVSTVGARAGSERRPGWVHGSVSE